MVALTAILVVACDSPRAAATLPSELSSMTHPAATDPAHEAHAVRVRVVDGAGRAVAGARVQVAAHWAAVTAPAHGLVGSSGVAAGATGADGVFAAQVRFGASVNGLHAAAVAGDLAGLSKYTPWQRDSGAPAELVIALAPGVFVAGLVEEAGGGPAVGADVYCTWSGNAFEMRTVTSDDGRFRLGPLSHAAALDDARLDARRGPGAQGWFVDGPRVQDVAAGTDVVMRLPPAPHGHGETK